MPDTNQDIFLTFTEKYWLAAIKLGLDLSAQRFQEFHGLAPPRRRQLALPHHPRATHDSADRPAGDRHAVIRRPAGARGDPCIRNGGLSLEVNDGKIGVTAVRH